VIELCFDGRKEFLASQGPAPRTPTDRDANLSGIF